MKIGIVSQKGGVGKSTLSRLLAREYALNDWSVLIADMDTSQATSTNWQRRRCEHDLLPYIASQQFTHVHQVNKQVDHYDLIIFDGAPHATQGTKEISSLSDLIIVPTGLSIDDLEPTIRLCNSLKEGGIDLKKIAIAFCRIGDNVAEVEEAEGYINKTPYFLLGGYLPERVAFRRASLEGKALTEISFPTLTKKAVELTNSIVHRLETLQDQST